ncbi:MAG TPA: molybdopterin-dependent oxidoreductase [Ktedonobacteraceae bacterium]|jgi:sulfoxide reductase catalytic subunit YedY|nr:molybdopterin-dependent oxidoreductase [Ktedonobacteraceae bacterium]
MNTHIVLAATGYFPLWERIQHYFNLLFIGIMIRSGIQILAAHPRLYWRDSSNPKKEWIKFTKAKVPENKLYTSMDDEMPVSPWLAQPGGDNLGLGRHWHFFVAIFWLLNGIIYWALLFATGYWSTLIPTSWTIFPHAWHAFVTYITFHIPPKSDFTPYDPLQQLAYAFVVFVLAPFQLVTAAAMSPSIEAHYPWYLKLLGGKQSARSLHFIGLILFIGFIIVHTALVFYVYPTDNILNITLGSEHGTFWLAALIFSLGITFAFAFYAWSTGFTLRHKRLIQHALGAVVDPVRNFLLHRETSKQRYTTKDITPYFWVNGRPPETEEYRQLAQNNFLDWKLEVCGLVEQPLQLSLADLRAMPKQTQITKHNCIQGWSGVAEWGGVCVSEVLKLCKPLPNARYLVFVSYQKGKESVKPELTEALSHTFYEVIDMELANHPQTILAYEMNGESLPIVHGAPVRLRVETLLGYKMVKYLRSIELVEDYSHVGQGQGGFREDFQYYGRGAEI